MSYRLRGPVFRSRDKLSPATRMARVPGKLPAELPAEPPEPAAMATGAPRRMPCTASRRTTSLDGEASEPMVTTTSRSSIDSIPPTN